MNIAITVTTNSEDDSDAIEDAVSLDSFETDVTEVITNNLGSQATVDSIDVNAGLLSPFLRLCKVVC